MMETVWEIIKVLLFIGAIVATILLWQYILPIIIIAGILFIIYAITH